MEPSDALQAAIYTALRNNTNAGPSVFDKARPGVFPRISIGSGQTVPDDAEGSTSYNVYCQIDVWSKGEGFPEAKTIAQQVRNALHKKDLPVEGFALVDLYLASTVFSRDPASDDISRARIDVEALMEAVDG